MLRTDLGPPAPKHSPFWPPFLDSPWSLAWIIVWKVPEEAVPMAVQCHSK